MPSKNKMSAVPSAVLLIPVVLLGSAESSLNSSALGGLATSPCSEFRAHSRTPSFAAGPGQGRRAAGIVLGSRSGSFRSAAEPMGARCGCMALGEGLWDGCLVLRACVCDQGSLSSLVYSLYSLRSVTFSFFNINGIIVVLKKRLICQSSSFLPGSTSRFWLLR